MILFTMMILSLICLASASLSFTAFGDWGGMSDPPYTTPGQIASAKGMSASSKVRNAKFNVVVGDNFYENGIEENTAFRFHDTFEAVFDHKDPAFNKPWFVVAGNHDHRGNVSVQIEYSKTSDIWTFPSPFYLIQQEFDGVTVDILMLDTVMLVGSWDDGVEQPLHEPELTVRADEQWSWIRKTMEASEADWLLVAGHYPIYSVAEHGPTQDLVRDLLPLMKAHGAAMYICGHEHNAQFLRADDVDMVVTGAIHALDVSHRHEGDVPKGSSKFYWPFDKHQSNDSGMFTVMEMFDKFTMNTTFIESTSETIATFTTRNPRAMH